jgi:uncharacterized protein (DUF2267 family)
MDRRPVAGQTAERDKSDAPPVCRFGARRSRELEETAVKYDEFISKVAREADISREAAQDLTAATLRTLAERITRGEAEDLAAQLPSELQGYLTKPQEPAERFDLEEFIRRVSERTGRDPDEVLVHMGAVFATLREAVTSGELEDIRAQLPEDLRGLIGAPT